MVIRHKKRTMQADFNNYFATFVFTDVHKYLSEPLG